MNETATFGAGCFWGVEAYFAKINGVSNTAVGYMGGTLDNPSYKDVCTGNTGHAEVLQFEYDPMIIPYNNLLNGFWSIHDPTTLNRQGPDIGSQYRSVIFCHTGDQITLAEKSKIELQNSQKYNAEIVTQILPAETFYCAEEYHQQYLKKHGLRSCSINL